MPVRATKRGAERTALRRDCDVLVCGASFAGLAVARELRDTGARVLVIDRYEIGERQTSACGIPTLWLEAMDLMGSLRQTFGELVVHTPWTTTRWQLPWTFSTFDYRELCATLWEQAQPGSAGTGAGGTNGGAAGVGDGAGGGTGNGTGSGGAVAPEFETATVTGRTGDTVHTDRGDIRSPLIVDALGWRRVLSGSTPIQPPNARLSRGLEVHPAGTGEELELWIDAQYIRSGYSWSFPAHDEVRVGVGSFWPSHHVREPTVRLASELGHPVNGYQGNWIPHQLRAAVEDGVFFAGDSAGHCLPLTAEGIRTAFYFGIACARELREVLAGRATRERALARYGAFSNAHERKYRWMLNSQRIIGRLTPSRAVTAMVRSFGNARVCAWAFNHYLDIAPPSFVADGGRRTSVRVLATTAAATPTA